MRLLFIGVFAFGTGLAALGGALGGIFLGVYPGIDLEIGLDAFIVVIVGGLGSIRGTFVASLLVAFIAQFHQGALSHVFGLCDLSAARRRYRGAADRPVRARRVGVTRTSGTRILALAIVAGIVGELGVVPDYYLGLLTSAVILALFAMSLDLLSGFTGLESLGHAAFFGTGAYVVALLGLHGFNRRGALPARCKPWPAC